jgi:plastocyanin
MEQPVHIESIGNIIFMKPQTLYVKVGDTVKFYVDDTNEYDIVIPNKDKFFVSATGATIELTATNASNPVTTAVNLKAVKTEKIYEVTTPGGGIADAPPKIIIKTS